MPVIPQPSTGRKIGLEKYYAYIFLGSAVLFICWVAFFLICSPRDKLTLLGTFAGLEILAFIYFRSELNNAVKTKTATMGSAIEEMKECQKMLLNDEKINVISKFASVIAHELKNPLSSMKNISYYLIRTVKQEDPKGKHMMEMLSSEVDRADRMISDFSDIARAKKIAKTAANVSQLVETTLDEIKLVSAAAPEGAIELKKEIEPGIEANIDAERIAQVLKNLIKNAVYAVGEKGQILVSLKMVGEYFELSVKDSGKGIEPETLEHIFEPMFTTKNKSLGLGLTVVKEVIAAHDGKVDVETEKDKGSIFRLFVPS